MSIWDMSVMMSGMIVIILIIRILGRKKLPKGTVLCLWNLALIRGLVPFQISLEAPIWNNPENSLPKWNRRAEIARVLELVKNRRQNAVWDIKGERNDFLGAEYWAWIWAVGAICLLLYFVYTYIREYRDFKKCTPAQNEMAYRLIRKKSFFRNIRLYEGEAFKTPVTYGVMFPKIVLPSQLDDVSRLDLRNMIAHELEHIRKFDVLKRYVLAAVLCLHWFNPLAWIMYRLYQEDQEIACDERVLRMMRGEKGKNYIYTMIKMSVEERGHFAATGFGGKSVGKRRILAALNPKRLRPGSILTVFAIGLCLGVTFISFSPVRRELPEALSLQTPSVIESAEEPRISAGAKIQQVAPVFEESGDLVWYDEDFDYQEVLQEITDNYNDLTQPLTEEQLKALRIQDYVRLSEYYKGILDEGAKLDSYTIWMIAEYYGRYENG